MKKEIPYQVVYLNFTKGNFSLEESLQEELIKNNEGICITALQAALKHDTKLSQEFISKVNPDELSEAENFLYFEVQGITAYFSNNFKDAKKFSKQAIALNPQAFFAMFTLARIFIRERDFETGISYYKSLLDKYPDSSGALLDLAQVTILNKGGYQEALRYVKSAERSLRRLLYLLLIPFGKTFVRLLWAIMAVLVFSIPGIGTIFFLISTVAVISALIATFTKIKFDALIISRLAFIQLGNTLLWFLMWMASK